MREYMSNNNAYIDKFQKLYKKGISVEEIKKEVFFGKFSNASLVDHFRFRIFLNFCLMLLNKEKFETELKERFSFMDYLKSEKDRFNIALKNARTSVAKDPNIPNVNIDEARLFYTLDGKNNYNPWSQSKIIRNAAAHAHYAQYISDEDGTIYYFYVDNVDETEDKEKDIHGIVIEEILHDWVITFFSNYSTFGIPYKHTCFSRHSFSDNSNKNKFLWTTFKLSKSYSDRYSGNDHPMRELGKKFSEGWDKLIEYVDNNRQFFTIEQTPLEDIFSFDPFEILKNEFNLKTLDEYTYGLKAILDPETELSNFLIHIMMLNDVIITLRSHEKNLEDDEKEEFIKMMALQLNELNEDTNAVVAFRLGFLMLKAMNLSFRMEKSLPEDIAEFHKIMTHDLKYVPIDYSKVDISGFMFENADVEAYAQENNITDNKNERFILAKIRNSLMHGNLKFELDAEKGVLFVFNDKYKGRCVTVKIDERAFERFIDHEAFYKDIDKSGISIKF